MKRYSATSMSMIENTHGAYVAYEDIKHLIPATPEEYLLWKLWADSQSGGYHIWVAKDEQGRDLYQCTIGPTPPQCNSGYYDLDALLKLKGIVK